MGSIYLAKIRNSALVSNYQTNPAGMLYGIAHATENYLQKIKYYFGQSIYDQVTAGFMQQSSVYTDSLRLEEWHLYGSSRIGIYQTNKAMAQRTVRIENGVTTQVSNTHIEQLSLSRFYTERGAKRYELTNHLGNVLTVVTDKKLPVCNGTSISYFIADVVSATDYSPFGAPLAGRTWQGGEYRYGFNGKENDNEVKSDGGQQDYGMRINDSRLGKFLSVDPLAKDYPWNSPYSFAENDVISCIDLDGAERRRITQWLWNANGTTTKLAVYTDREDEWQKGTVYDDEYFFTKSSGEIKYYTIKSNTVRGTAMMAMHADNPEYFIALNIYHNQKQEKFNREVQDISTITGGGVSLVLSFGTSSQILAFFGLATGASGIFGGACKLNYDINGEFNKSDQMPTSPLGILGAIIDDIRNDKDLTVQQIGDFANTLISLTTANWSKWDKLNAADKLLGAKDIFTAIYTANNKKINDRKLLEYSQHYVEIMDQLSEIYKANGESLPNNSNN